jgi:hypothetical protein
LISILSTYVAPGATATIHGNTLTLNIDNVDDDAHEVKVTFHKETRWDYENVSQTDTFWERKYLKFAIIDRVAMVIQPYHDGDGNSLGKALMFFSEKQVNQ